MSKHSNKEIQTKVKELKKLADSDDPEYAHAKADEILCDILVALGHQDVVEAFLQIKKWYS